LALRVTLDDIGDHPLPVHPSELLERVELSSPPEQGGASSSLEPFFVRSPFGASIPTKVDRPTLAVERGASGRPTSERSVGGRPIPLVFAREGGRRRLGHGFEHGLTAMFISRTTDARLSEGGTVRDELSFWPSTYRVRLAYDTVTAPRKGPHNSRGE
jgi:hypothetical protein